MASTPIRINGSGDEQTNHEATAPSQKQTEVIGSGWEILTVKQLLVKPGQSFSHLFSEVIIPV